MVEKKKLKRRKKIVVPLFHRELSAVDVNEISNFPSSQGYLNLENSKNPE